MAATKTLKENIIERGKLFFDLWVEECGYRGQAITAEDLPRIGMDYLCAQRNLWEFVYRRNIAIDKKDVAELDQIAKDEYPHIDKCKSFINLLNWLHYYRLVNIRESKKAVEQEIETCKNDIVHFFNYWCWTYDPRLISSGLLPKNPLVLFPKQVECINAIEQNWKHGQSMIVDKSRDEGASYLFAGWGMHHFLFVPGFSMEFGSEVEEKVDRLGSYDPLLGKLRFMLYNTPPFLRPAELQNAENKNDSLRKIINPSMMSEIRGGVGDSIGRSGRASALMIDEYQDIEHPDIVDASISETANSKFYVGTVKGMNHHYRKLHSKEAHPFTIGWEHDPRKNPKWETGEPDRQFWWFRYKKMTTKPHTFAQEIERDPAASIEGAFIPSEHVRAAVDFDIPLDGKKVAGFDIAAGGENKSVYIVRTGVRVHRIEVINSESVTQCLYNAIKIGEDDGISDFNYDMSGGLGKSAHDIMEMREEQPKFRLNGIISGEGASEELIDDEGRTGKQKFRNKRAELWWNLRERFERTWEHVNGKKIYPYDELISIPNDPVLITQLSTVKLLYASDGSRYRAESKIEMKKRGMISPDHADACVYCFADAIGTGQAINQFDYTVSADQFVDFEMDFDTFTGDSYISLYQDDKMTVSGICCAWYPHSNEPGLRVFKEFVYENPRPQEVIAFVNQVCSTGMHAIKEWICNKEMVPQKGDMTEKPFYNYYREGVTLNQNWTNDWRGSILTINSLFANKIIKIHRSCSKTMYQLSTMKRSGDQQKNFGLAMALCQLAGHLRTRDVISKEMISTEFGQKVRYLENGKVEKIR